MKSLIRLKVLKVIQNHRTCFSNITNKAVSYPSPLIKYKNMASSGKINLDSHQLDALQELSKLHYDLLKYDHEAYLSSHQTTKKSNISFDWFSSLFSSQSETSHVEEPHIRAPKSFYIWGGTGSGKTFMMDLFYDNLHFIPKKKRLHYSQFMIDIHKRLFQLKSNPTTTTTTSSSSSSSSSSSHTDIWDKLAIEIIQEYYILCLDEFQVTDIADAMILQSLFTTLFHYGLICIMTSNRPPNQLYWKGLQRDLFLPFINLLYIQCIVHSIKESTTDYRMVKHKDKISQNIYWNPITPENETYFKFQFYSFLLPNPTDSIWKYHFIDSNQIPSFTKNKNNDQSSTNTPMDIHTSIDKYGEDEISIQSFTQSYTLQVQGHNLYIPYIISGRRVAMMSFSLLCGEAYGSADYIALAERFAVLFLSHIPILSIENRNELRRLIILIDILYEHHVRLVLLSAVPITELLSLSAEEKATSTYDEVFAFDRTLSRLLEMQSAEYVTRVSKLRPIGTQFLHHLHIQLRSLNISPLKNTTSTTTNTTTTTTTTTEKDKDNIHDNITLKDQPIEMNHDIYVSNQSTSLSSSSITTSNSYMIHGYVHEMRRLPDHLLIAIWKEYHLLSHNHENFTSPPDTITSTSTIITNSNGSSSSSMENTISQDDSMINEFISDDNNNSNISQNSTTITTNTTNMPNIPINETNNSFDDIIQLKLSRITMEILLNDLFYSYYISHHLREQGSSPILHFQDIESFSTDILISTIGIKTELTYEEYELIMNRLDLILL